MIDIRPLAIRAVSAAAVLGLFAVAQPNLAFADDMAPPAAQAAPMHMHHHHHRDPLEARIADLHTKLKITEAQEPQWAAVNKVMRDYDKESRTLVEEKRKAEKTVTALDDLRAYADIATAHGKYAQDLATTFAALYDSMSADQKKVADEAFRAHKRRAMGHAH